MQEQMVCLYSLEELSPPGNSLCHGWGCSGEFGRMSREQSCVLKVPAMRRWFEVFDVKLPEPQHAASSQLLWGWCCSVGRAEQGQLCREQPGRSPHLFLQPMNRPATGTHKGWCWTPSAPCLLPLLQNCESFPGLWERRWTAWGQQIGLINF